MDQLWDFFNNLFSSEGFPPRWHCGKWTSFHGWFYILSDLLIWSAYFTIPLIIVSYISKRKDVRFLKVYYLFAAFILFCGATHLLDALTFWLPIYRFNALIKFITGVLSWLTVYSLIKMLPSVFSLKTTEQLEAEVEIRKKTEEQLKKKNIQLNEAQAIAKMGSWEWDMVSKKISWSEGLYHVYEIEPKEDGLSYDEFISCIHPEDRTDVNDQINQTISNKKFTEYYHRIVTPSGHIKTLHAKGDIQINENKEIIKMYGTGQDVTEQKKSEQELMIKTRELQEMNNELQKFAYVASHDLQEPLRKIKTFASRIETVFHSSDENSPIKTYLSKIKASANRMKNLMDDILDFSKMSSGRNDHVSTDLNIVIREVLSDMEVIIELNNAKINIAHLNTIETNPIQIGQLFQNLIANAIKFKKTNSVPEIFVNSEIISGHEIDNSSSIKLNYKFLGWGENHLWSNEKFCRITIKDLGIGFDNIYKEKIFNVFERLHTFNKYEGTGIGLAVCKKIVEYHHGMISANSSATEGTIFTIILPVSQQNFSIKEI